MKQKRKHKENIADLTKELNSADKSAKIIEKKTWVVKERFLKKIRKLKLKLFF